MDNISNDAKVISKNKIIIAGILVIIIVGMLLYVFSNPEIFKPKVRCSTVDYGGKIMVEENCSLKEKVSGAFDERKRGEQTNDYNSSDVTTT